MRATRFFFFIWTVFMISVWACDAKKLKTDQNTLKVGAERIDKYLKIIEGKRVGLLINHTSYINNTHLLDTLLSYQIDVRRVFAPEHGFRGNKSNGAQIKDGIDEKTGIPIVSLYGKNKKPSSDDLAELDVIIYDIQDVGARFYTYISSMHYMMEACNENSIKMIILDRPNPNGSYVDGPVLKLEHKSFVGMHPIPIVYGLTPGELAHMIIGENWIENTKTLDLEVIKLSNWEHNHGYNLPIAPSPNLPNQQSILLYPSLCLFEGTQVSVGRGTDFPFQVIGLPTSTGGTFSFTPVSKPGYSKYPKHQNIKCYGKDLRNITAKKEIDLSHLIEFYDINKSSDYFNSFFTKLVGNTQLQEQIESSISVEDIKKSWSSDINAYLKLREQYLLYP